MNENETNVQDFNRRDFLKGGSVATLMTMLGAVDLFAETSAATSADETKPVGPKVKVAVVGLGTWGREILNTLAQISEADITAICDTYPASLRRGSSAAPAAAQTPDYKTILENKEIKAVIIATPTHLHKDIALAALKAGKHVYCEAPLANSIEDARAIASAAKTNKQLIFQTGLQLRADPQRHFLVPFIRSGAIGQSLMARAQYHKKQSWRATSPKPEREKELNWRLSKDTSSGLIGELGCHALDQTAWFLNLQPTAVTGFGSISFWKDGRDVPDTVQAMMEFPGGITLTYDATLANSFDGEFEIFFGSDSAIMLREAKAWLFKEVDSPLLGWEVYASKETFYKETGIVLKANASKSVPASAQTSSAAQFTNTPLSSALTTFLRNCTDMSAALEDAVSAFGPDDAENIAAQIAKVQKRPAAGYLEGFQNAVTVIKANEAILSNQRMVLKPEWYQLA